jgi:hypothetical protein
MLEALSLFVIAIGAVLVSIARIIRIAWLAVLIPLLIAGGAGYWLIVLARGRRRAHPVPDRPQPRHAKPSDRMAA